MKNLLLFIFCSGIIIACKKDTPVIYNNGVLGKWELVEYYVNPGAGPSEWQQPDDDFKHTIEFKSNGDFITDAGLYFDATAFEIPDSSSIKFLNSTQAGGDLQYLYTLEEHNSILVISPMCFEGCAYKYKALE